MTKIEPVNQLLSGSVWSALASTITKGTAPTRLDSLEGVNYAIEGSFQQIIAHIGYPRVQQTLPGTVVKYNNGVLHVPLDLPDRIEGKKFGYLQVHQGGICTHVLDIFEGERVQDRYAINHPLMLLTVEDF